MKPGVLLVVALVSVGSVPLLAGPGLDWLGMQDVKRVLAGEDVRRVASEIAEREFSPNVSLAVLSRERVDSVEGEFGERIRPEPGHVFEREDILLANHGRLDVSVHTFHFSVVEDSGRERKAETGIATKFEVMGVQQGAAAQGLVVFEVPVDAKLTTLVWQGELANATLALGP